MSESSDEFARLKSWLERPSPIEIWNTAAPNYFDPWEALGLPIYGYASAFDQCAIQVLEGFKKPYQDRRSDLSSDMFREMLCAKDFCDYGTSPRGCFPNLNFAELLPLLIDKWKEHYALNWDEPYVEDPSDI